MSKTKSYLAILMGVIIILADIYWLVIPVGGFVSYNAFPWLMAGIVIFVASVIWIYLDYDLMTK